MQLLLRLDAAAGFLVGAILLAAGAPLAEGLTLPPLLLPAMGVVNLAYGASSLPLSLRADPPLGRIRVLIAANAAWALVCVLLAALVDAGPLGRAYLVGEGLFVGGLALLERRALS